MFEIVRRHASVALTAAVVCTLFTAGPGLARAAFDASNADRVDGRHAVGADATSTSRAGKLVATNSGGRLPNNIIATAPNAAKLGGHPGGFYRIFGTGSSIAATTINSCGSGAVHSYAVQLTRTSRIFASATSTYGRSNPGPERPSIRVQLLNASATVVASTGRVSVDGTSGNPSMNVSGVLLTDGRTPYAAPAGTYLLRVWGDNFGACTGFGQYQDINLSHLVLPVA
jgi:hypothetical protein